MPNLSQYMMLNVHLKQKACKDSEIYSTYSRGKKKQPTDNVPNEAQTLNLIVNDTKSSVKNMFKELKKMMFKEVKERIKVMSHQIDTNNETETVKNNQMLCNQKGQALHKRGIH